MEEKMIGRPSTTATIFKLLKDRKYITGGEGGEKLLKITSLGEQVGRELMKSFSSVINLEYSIKMEQTINAIADGQNDLYVKNLSLTKSNIQNEIKAQGISLDKPQVEMSDKKCPKCGKPLAIREGKYGKFLACTGFPKCKYLENIPGESKPREFKDSGKKCPECGKPLALRTSKKGVTFLACTGYPDCKHVE
jgi:DNA topoisomerase-1